MAGFIFGAPGLPKTQAELDNLRKITQAMAMRQQKAPSSIGEGLNAIGQALVYRGMMDDLAKGQTNIASQQAAAWPGIIGLLGGGASAPAVTPSPAPSTPSPATITPPPANGTAGAALSPVPLSQSPQPMSGGGLSQNASALTDAVAKLESGNSPVDGPAQGYANYRFQQFPAFAKQYGTGADGVINYAKQVAAANPNATFGDMYGGYVTGTGNPATAAMRSLQTTTQPGAQGAYGNLVRNSPVDPKTPLSQLLASGLGDLLGPASAYADTPKPTDTLMQQPMAFNGQPTRSNPLANPPPEMGLLPYTPPPDPSKQVAQALMPSPAGPAPNVTNLQTRPVDLPAGMGAREAITRALTGQTSVPAAPQAAAAPAPAPVAAPVNQGQQQAARAMQLLQQYGNQMSPEQQALVVGIIKQGMTPPTYGFQTLPDGTIIRTDPRAGSVAPIYHAETKPTFGVIGETPMGGKQYGFINSVKQTTTPVTPPANAQPTDNLVNLHGEEFLGALDKSNPGVASQVRAIVEGRAPYPTGMLLKTPYGQTLAQYVTQADPSFESGNPTARTKVQSDLATGKLGQNNNALNTAIGHLGELSQAAQKLDNGNFRIVNGVRNFISTETGSPEVTNFNTIRDKVAEEFTRVYRGAGGSESDIKREIDNLNTSNSPQQLHQAIDNMASLAESKIRANEAQYGSTMGPLAKKKAMVTDETRAVLERLHKLAAGDTSAPAPSAAPALPQGWSVKVH